MTRVRALYRQKATSPSVNDGRRGMAVDSLVVVMAVRCQYKNDDLCFKYAIHQTVFLGYLATPSAFGLTFQRLRVSSTCLGVFAQLHQKTLCLLKSLRLKLFQFSQTFVGFWSVSEFIEHSHIVLTCRKQIRLAIGLCIPLVHIALRLCRYWHRIPPCSSALNPLFGRQVFSNIWLRVPVVLHLRRLRPWRGISPHLTVLLSS